MAGDVIANDTFYGLNSFPNNYPTANTVVFSLVGTADHALSGTGVIHNLEFAKPNGSLTLRSGAAVAFDINGPTAGSEHDQIAVNSAVSINSAATFSATGTQLPSASLALLANDGPDALSGRFSGLSANPSSYTIGDVTTQLSTRAAAATTSSSR